MPSFNSEKAQGAYLELEDGSKIIDAISSWWCKSLGHGHPELKSALVKQLECYEHVIHANTCQNVLVELSEKLSLLCPGLNKVFYASEGSTAVEIAIKMSLHSRTLSGLSKRNKLMALQNGYHGESFLALSLSDLPLYKKPYEPWLSAYDFIKDIPYVTSSQDPLWEDCGSHWKKIESQLEPFSEVLSAIIIEPIVQGAGGMLIYSQDFLKRLRTWTLKHNIHLIADEIMTGIGRTGYPLACQHAGIQPDLLCLGKGLTSGWLPMSAVLTSDSMYHFFYDDYEKGRSFLHSNTFSGNALAAAVAVETLNIMERESIYLKVRKNESLLLALMHEVAEKTQVLSNIRNIGYIVAADLITQPTRQLTRQATQTRPGFKVFQQALTLGAFLRPLGNTIYWLPPLNTEIETLYQLKEITIHAILNYLKEQ